MKRHDIDAQTEPPVAFAAFDRLFAGATTGTVALFSTNTTVSTFALGHGTSGDGDGNRQTSSYLGGSESGFRDCMFIGSNVKLCVNLSY